PLSSYTLSLHDALPISPYTDFRERLRPMDFPALGQAQDYHEHNHVISLGTSYLPKATVQAYYQWGTGVNFVPPATQPPALASERSEEHTSELQSRSDLV